MSETPLFKTGRGASKIWISTLSRVSRVSSAMVPGFQGSTFLDWKGGHLRLITRSASFLVFRVFESSRVLGFDVYRVLLLTGRT